MFRFIDNLCAINVKYRELDPELYDKIDAFPFYIEFHFEIAICQLEFFLQQLGLGFYVLPERLT